jgi:uncharacterized protein (DUF433 family)
MTKAISEAASAPALEQDVEPIDWRRFIHADKSIIAGKPVVKGTRLGAEFILRLFAGGMTTEEVLENYPGLTPEALRAVFSFAAEVVGEEIWSVLPPLER